MEELGLNHKPKRKPNGITKADKEARKSDDLIKRDFSAQKPLEKCITDMTEIKASDGKLYVSAIFDNIMAINKTVNKSTKTHGAMRNCMEYVLRESKINSSLVYVSGPFDAEEITYDTVYRSFLEEKKLWNKDSGRMYAHNIISWHKDEKITPEEAYEFGKGFVEQWFAEFQTLMAVHVDRNHIHLHMVTNTVSYIDGHKLHTTKNELEEMKQLTNRMCESRGWSTPEKGKDYHGNDLEMGHVRAWSKDKYHMLLHNVKESYVAACALAILEAKADACSQDDFIRNMKQKGWHVIWKPTRKNITFVNEEGKKVRDRNILKTFNINVTK